MRPFRLLALLILSGLGTAGCQKTIHEVRGPLPQPIDHPTARLDHFGELGRHGSRPTRRQAYFSLSRHRRAAAATVSSSPVAAVNFLHGDAVTDR
jgi:hypothetical protein